MPHDTFQVAMPAVDAHLHVFPDEASGLLAQGGERLAGHAGVVEEVRAIAARTGITRVLALNTAIGSVLRDFGQSEEQIWANVVEANEWICRVGAEGDVIAPALAADPTVDSTAMTTHLRDMLGLYDVRAIKVHPAIAHVMPDDPGFMAIYGVARDAGVPVVSHGGSSEGAFYESDVQYCAPTNFTPVLGQFPDLVLVIAHLGQPFFDDLLAVGAAHPNAYTDLSFALGARLIEPERLRHTVRTFGVDRVMFGTDFPFFDPADSLDYLSSAGFTAGELEQITGANAERVFFS
jgi:predicted TIM-barrel fold metal-dependent hydrolase